MRLLTAVSLSALWFSPVALACSCASSDACPGLGGAGGPVFLGTVLAVTDLPRTGDFMFLSSRKARLRVDESFGGLPADTHEVDVLTGSGGGDCGIPFRVGEVYLIDAYVGDGGLFHAGICSKTRRVDFASVPLRILRQLRDGQQAPSLAGQIAEHDRDFDSLLGTHNPRPLANITVRVKADGKMYETLADAEGFYSFYGLPSGKYEFAPDLPPGTTLSWFIGSDEPLASFDLEAGRCQERDIEVFPSGSIQGRIFDSSNKLLHDAFVYIVPAREKALPKESQLYWECSCTRDFFKFVHIPPGQYLILVNPDDKQDPNFPYGRTFYPGVHDRESATIITVHGGEQIKDVDLRLDKQFAPRHLTVRVTWADGRLIRTFVFVEAKGTVNKTAMADAARADPKASVFDLRVLPNETYEVRARLICRYADERSIGPGAKLESNQVVVGPHDNRAELSLTIPASSCPEVPGKTLQTDQ